MREKPNPQSTNYAKLVTAQQAIIASVFTVTARIDQQQLRAKEQDKMAKLLEELRRATAGNLRG